jgi:hypothetical protein
MRLTQLCALTIVTAGLLARPSVGQELDGGTTTRIQGEVLDLETGAPLPGAFVAPRGLRTGFLADSLGRFVLHLPSAPVHYLYVERLGYVTSELDVGAVEGERPLQILLRPDPVLLDGIEVLANRWDRRRRFFDGSVRVFEQADLVRSGAMDMLSLVKSRAGAHVRRCGPGGLEFCVWRRGRLRRMDVCLDEMHLFDGGRALETFSPQDFYMVEVYDRGMQVRVYTEHFVAQAASRGLPVRPLEMGC